jgi:hypothetical protein
VQVAVDKRVRKTVLLLAATALLLYFGFIFMAGTGRL